MKRTIAFIICDELRSRRLVHAFIESSLNCLRKTSLNCLRKTLVFQSLRSSPREDTNLKDMDQIIDFKRNPGEMML